MTTTTIRGNAARKLAETPLPESPRRWKVKLMFFEDRSTTVARAVLKRSDDHRMEATGAARRYPADPSMPAVGEELAGAGALFALAHDLIDEAATAIDTGTPEVE